MRSFRKVLLSFVFIGLSAPLAGCETMDTAMTDMQQRFSQMEWHMPEITPSAQETYIDDDRMVRPTLARDELPEPEAPGTEMQTASIADPSSTNIVMEDPPAPAYAAAPDMPVVAGDEGCPSVSVIEELKALHQFSNPDMPSPQTKISEVTVAGLKTSCRYTDRNVAVEIDLTFNGRLGPAAKMASADKPSFAYPYFVAITTPNGNIAAKEVFAATVNYEEGSDTVTHHESLRQIIPVNGDFGADQSLLIGFQLTEGELAYNRSVLGMPDYRLTSTDEPLAAAKIETSSGREEPSPVKKAKAVKPPPQKPEQVAAKAAAPAEPAEAPIVSPFEPEVAPVAAPAAEPAFTSATEPAAPVATDAAVPSAEPLEAQAEELESTLEEVAPGVTETPAPAPAAAQTTAPAPAQAPASEEAIDITAD